jgi:hypothetical protein
VEVDITADAVDLASVDFDVHRREIDERRIPANVDARAAGLAGEMERSRAPVRVDERLAGDDDLRARDDRVGRDLRERQTFEPRIRRERARTARDQREESPPRSH